MKRLIAAGALALMLVGCSASPKDAIKLVANTIKNDVKPLIVLGALETKEEEFAMLVDDILYKAEENFEAAEALIPQAVTSLTEIKNTISKQTKELALSEKEIKKVEKMKSELEEADSTASVVMLEGFLDYKNYLKIFLESKVEGYETYEGFLTQIKGDMGFKDIEVLIASLNKSLESIGKAHENYKMSVESFSVFLNELNESK